MGFEPSPWTVKASILTCLLNPCNWLYHGTGGVVKYSSSYWNSRTAYALRRVGAPCFQNCQSWSQEGSHCTHSWKQGQVSEYSVARNQFNMKRMMIFLALLAACPYAVGFVLNTLHTSQYVKLCSVAMQNQVPAQCAC
uniref:Uncharacterized protein n=1 Tax=Mus musculus TaxID=10090 RepID=Q8C9K4_MOUSE|nr:unnamed protein product [Mus musculus]